MQVDRSHGSCNNNCFEPKPKNLFVLSLLSLMVAAGAGAAGYYLGGRNFTTALIAGGATLGVELLGGGVMVIRRCKRPQDSPPGQNPGAPGTHLQRPQLPTNSLASSAGQPAVPNWQTPLLSGQPPDAVLPQPVPTPDVTPVKPIAPEPIEDASGNLTMQGAKNICEYIVQSFDGHIAEAKEKNPQTGAVCISNDPNAGATRPKDEIHRCNAQIARPLIFTTDGAVALRFAKGRERIELAILKEQLKKMSDVDRNYILNRIKLWPVPANNEDFLFLHINIKGSASDQFEMWLQ